MAVLLILQVGLAFLCLKSPQVRKLLSGVPSIMIRNGRIVESELRRQRYAVDELLLQLREKGYTNPQDVEFAILEASGNLSVVPKASKRPVTPEDLGFRWSMMACPIPDHRRAGDRRELGRNQTRQKLVDGTTGWPRYQ